MEDIWNKACRTYEIPDEVASTWFHRIQERLSQETEKRRYHNWQELLLSKQELLRGCSAHLVLAAFFQYYTFDGRQTCVTQNCMAFEEFCRDADFQDVETKQVILKLLGDKSSVPVRCCDEDASLLQDMDLMILGSPPEEYRRYAKLLREEYACMSDAEYKQMRLKVLETLLRIPYIFATCEFQAKYEEPARANIKQEIEELKQ